MPPIDLGGYSYIKLTPHLCKLCHFYPFIRSGKNSCYLLCLPLQGESSYFASDSYYYFSSAIFQNDGNWKVDNISERYLVPSIGQTKAIQKSPYDLEPHSLTELPPLL